MEELQLSLTAARVDQKNFGLWISSWRVGQMLSALVTDRLPSGQLLLTVAGHQMTATADIPVQKGAVLMLEVTSLQPVPVLKVVTPSATRTESAPAVQSQIQQWLASQRSVIEPLLTMVGDKSGAIFLSLLPGVASVLKQLQRDLPPIDDLLNPATLRQAARDSGLFLESRLRRQPPPEQGKTDASSAAQPRLNPEQENFEPDLKAQLLQLSGQTREQIQQLSAQLPFAEKEALLGLQRSLDGALATISLKQLSSARTEAHAGTGWAFDIPLRWGNETTVLSLYIEEQGERDVQGEDGGNHRNWRITLHIDVPALGPVEAELALQYPSLQIRFYAQQQATARLLGQQAEALCERLQQGGLQVVLLRSDQGIRQRPGALVEGYREFHGKVDESA